MHAETTVSPDTRKLWKMKNKMLSANIRQLLGYDTLLDRHHVCSFSYYPYSSSYRVCGATLFCLTGLSSSCKDTDNLLILRHHHFASLISEAVGDCLCLSWCQQSYSCPTVLYGLAKAILTVSGTTERANILTDSLTTCWPLSKMTKQS